MTTKDRGRILQVLACALAVHAVVAIDAQTPIILESPFSFTTAQYLAELSAIAYCSKPAIDAWNCAVCDRSLLRDHLMVKSADGQLTDGFITDNGHDLIVVAFTGTATVKQWMVDLHIAQEPLLGCNGCKVHTGFNSASQRISPDLMARLETALTRLPMATVVVTGHSLGAALAHLFAYHFRQSFANGVTHNRVPPTVVYTFGSPRVGNAAFVEAYNRLVPHSYRLVHNEDPVPHLPPEWTGYTHAGVLVYCPTATQCEVSTELPETRGLLRFDEFLQYHVNYVGVNLHVYGAPPHVHSGCDPSTVNVPLSSTGSDSTTAELDRCGTSQRTGPSVNILSIYGIEFPASKS